MSYKNTFIEISPDSAATKSLAPTSTRTKKPAHIIQYELLTQNPYTFNHEELVFEVYVRHKEIPEAELADYHDKIWHELHSKGHPCMRASTLTKKFGWGSHYNSEGKIALYGMDSSEYANFVEDEETKNLLGMRSKR
ncbi:MAG: DUF6157 family protein [Anaerolineae bacterium]